VTARNEVRQGKEGEKGKTSRKKEKEKGGEKKGASNVGREIPPLTLLFFFLHKMT